jgi:hypothetical protein
VKKDDYTDIICKGFCTFYREGREGLTCGTYDFLARNLTAGEIRSNVQQLKPGADFSRDKELRELACERCDFLVDGCDFREGLSVHPCGGYVIVEWLLKRGF